VSFTDFGTPGKVIAAADTTGANGGNLTIQFKPVSLGIWLSQFVIYHMVLENLTIGAQAKIILNANTYGYFGPATGAGREWFGALYLKSGDELDFLFNLATSTAKPWPALTAYVIYDPSLPGNTGHS
jgi:hypothetical protein